ncbi:MAG TPA: FGGY-family carbohydrate kinase [Polyangiaceae bacterium]|nr:FGGY-family carbohydrate kinase [Polyangiaceae bacterium]
MALYLGLDSSTQSLSALVIDTDSGRIVRNDAVNFGNDLPEYQSPNGFLPHADPQVKHSDPLMWVAALDLLFGRMRESGFDFAAVAGISGAGQQHGSVYLATPIDEAPAWSASSALVEQVRPLLSRPTSPIWMDSSTVAECREIAEAAGGDSELVRVTGSRAIERFTGPQIRKFWKTERALYERTREIHLVSSFMASVLAGTSVAIELGDGAGMNLLDLEGARFSPKLLEATAPGLEGKLRPAVPSNTVVGEIAPYFVERYGFERGTPIVAFTGDNPSSLVGMGATEPGTAVISLGTSDTVFAAMREPRTDPRGFGHVFGNPAGGFMCLICFANGSLARERIRERLALDWTAFERAVLEQSRPGNDGALLLPYFVPEITPKLLNAKLELFGDPDFVALRDAPRVARAIIEAQALAMQRYSEWIGERPTRILATGGASRNRAILQVIADVFQAEVQTLAVGNSSALGGALRAAQAVGGVPYAKLYERFAAPDGARAEPQVSRETYDALRARFATEIDKLS